MIARFAIGLLALAMGCGVSLEQLVAEGRWHEACEETPLARGPDTVALAWLTPRLASTPDLITLDLRILAEEEVAEAFDGLVPEQGELGVVRIARPRGVRSDLSEVPTGGQGFHAQFYVGREHRWRFGTRAHAEPSAADEAAAAASRPSALERGLASASESAIGAATLADAGLRILTLGLARTDLASRTRERTRNTRRRGNREARSAETLSLERRSQGARALLNELLRERCEDSGPDRTVCTRYVLLEPSVGTPNPARRETFTIFVQLDFVRDGVTCSRFADLQVPVSTSPDSSIRARTAATFDAGPRSAAIPAAASTSSGSSE